MSNVDAIVRCDICGHWANMAELHPCNGWPRVCLPCRTLSDPDTSEIPETMPQFWVGARITLPNAPVAQQDRALASGANDTGSTPVGGAKYV